MPANVVKTAEDEEKWEKAKQLAKEQGRDGDYAYIMGIFKKMKGISKSMMPVALFSFQGRIVARFV